MGGLAQARLQVTTICFCYISFYRTGWPYIASFFLSVCLSFYLQPDGLAQAHQQVDTLKYETRDPYLEGESSLSPVYLSVNKMYIYLHRQYRLYTCNI